MYGSQRAIERQMRAQQDYEVDQTAHIGSCAVSVWAMIRTTFNRTLPLTFPTTAEIVSATTTIYYCGNDYNPLTCFNKILIHETRLIIK